MGYNNNKNPMYCSVTNLRDSTKIKANLGKQMLDIFVKQPEKPNIFESFSYIDRREDRIRATRDNDPNFTQKFEEYCEVYKKYPDCFRLPSSQNPKKKYYKKPYVDTQHRNFPNNTNYYPSGKYQQAPENEEQMALEQENTEYRDYKQYRGANKSVRGRGYTRGGRGPRFYANKRGDHYNYHQYGGHDVNDNYNNPNTNHTNGYEQGNYYQRDM